MVVNTQFVVVVIDKFLQQKKQEMISDVLFASPKYIAMKRNLQFGGVVQISELAHKNFPEMEEGDLLLFHHTIENDDWRLLDKEENGNEYRLIDNSLEGKNFEIFGVIKDDGRLIPTKQHIFLSPQVSRFLPEIESFLIKSDSSIWQDESIITQKLEDADLQVRQLSETLQNMRYDTTKNPPPDLLDKAKNMSLKLNGLMEEKMHLTKLMHSRNLISCTVENVHEDTTAETGITVNTKLLADKKVLYPFDIAGKTYLIINKEEVIASLNW